MKDTSIVGDLINFRGLVYSPINENGVIFLFGRVTEDLNMYIEEIKPGFPDCVARRFVGKGWERISIEFEYRSSNFRDHKHDPKECDVLVCWENDWVECPIEVIELKKEIKDLENTPVERPNTRIDKGQPSLQDQVKSYPEKVQKLFELFDQKVKEISDEIWNKAKRTGGGATYYSPVRVFLDVVFQKQGLNVYLFTRGETLDGVKSHEQRSWGAKWGNIHLRDEKDLDVVLEAVKKSYKLINEAIKHNEPTSWGSSLTSPADKSNEQDFVA